MAEWLDALIKADGNFLVAAEKLNRRWPPLSETELQQKAIALKSKVAEDPDAIEQLTRIFRFNSLLDVTEVTQLVAKELKDRVSEASVSTLLRAYPALLDLLSQMAHSTAPGSGGQFPINYNEQNTTIQNKVELVLNGLPDEVRREVIDLATRRTNSPSTPELTQEISLSD